MTGGSPDLDDGLDVARSYYVMALRDLLPLAVGCHLIRARVDDPDGLSDAVCWLIQEERKDRAVQEVLHSVVSDFVARDGVFAYEERWEAATPAEVPLVFHDYRLFDDPSDELNAINPDPGHQAYFDGTALTTIAVTGGDWDGNEHGTHWNRGFRLLSEWIDALRVYSPRPLPAISDVESIDLFYIRVVELPDGNRQVQNLIIDEHGFPNKWHSPIGRDVTENAAQHFIERRNGDPTALVLNWVARARSARSLGDHGQAVVYCGIAAEQAINHVLCMLQWEDNNRSSSAGTYDLGSLFQLHSAASQKRLGSKLRFEPDVDKPACAPEWKAWRTDIVDIRNRILHSGHLPSAVECDSAVGALTSFINYLTDRIAASAKVYPKCAAVWCDVEAISPRWLRRRIKRLNQHRFDFASEYSDELRGSS